MRLVEFRLEHLKTSISSIMPKRRRINVAPARVPHSWEQAAHSWEAPLDSDREPADFSDSDLEADTQPDTPGNDLVAHMFSMLMSGVLSCQQFAVAMYYASKAGVKERRHCINFGSRDQTL